MEEGACKNTVLSNLADNLRLVLVQIQDLETERKSAGDFSLDVFWLRYCSAVQSVAKEATKFSMVFSQSDGTPCNEDVSGLIGDIERSILTLVSSYYYLPQQQGSTLRKIINGNTVGIVRGMVDMTLKAGSAHQLHSTGNVWELCDAVQDLPRDNKQAALIVISECLSLVSDALAEIEQAVTEDREEWQNLEIHLVDQTELDEKWSEADRRVLVSSVGLVKTKKHCLKNVIAAIQSKGNCNCGENIGELDRIGDIITTLSSLVDDFVSLLYPPMCHQSAVENGGALAVAVTNILDIAKESHYVTEGDSEWINFLHMAVKHNMDKLNLSVVTTPGVTP